jgi:hypothetical protein
LDKSSKELSEKLRDSEARSANELDTLKTQSDERIGHLMGERSELREKLGRLESEAILLKREREEKVREVDRLNGEVVQMGKMVDKKTTEFEEARKEAK